MKSSKLLTTLSIIIAVIIPAAISDLDSTEDGSPFEDDTALSFNPTLPSGADSEASVSLDQLPLLHLDDPNAPALFNPAPISGDFISATDHHDLDTSDAFLLSDMNADLATSSNIDNINGHNLFFDDNNNENDGNSFQLVDCSGSESLPASDFPLAFDTLDTLPNLDIAQSRLRRREGGGQECVNPATTPRTDSQSRQRGSPNRGNLEVKFGQLLEDPEMLDRATASTSGNQNHNTPCFVITDGRLPWGVCSSGRVGEQERVRQIFLFAAARELVQWRLTRATLGTFLQKVYLLPGSCSIECRPRSKSLPFPPDFL